MSSFLCKALLIIGGLFALSQVATIVFPRYFIWKSYRTESREAAAKRAEEENQPQARFVRVIQSGSTDELRTLVAGGVDPNSFIGYESALYWSILMNRVEMAKALIELGAQVNVSNAHGYVPLTLAAGRGYEEVVAALIQAGAQIDHQTKDGTTPLMSAARAGHDEIVRQLLKAGARPNLLNNRHQSAATLATVSGHQEIAKRLRSSGTGSLPDLIWEGKKVEALRAIKAGAPLEERDRRGWTALLVATQEGNSELVEILLKAGANVNAENAGQTAITGAISRKNISMVRRLLAAGYDASRPLNAGALRLAVVTKQENVVRELLKARFPVDNSDLEDAVESGNMEIAKMVLTAGTDVNYVSPTMETPLMAAAQRGYPSMTRLLLEAGAKVNTKNRQGWNALMIAADLGFTDVVEILTSAKSEPSLADLGITRRDVKLFGAIQWGKLDHVANLLKEGANPNGKFGDSPLTRAATRGNVPMVKLLLGHGASVNEPRCCPSIAQIRRLLTHGRRPAGATKAFHDVIQILLDAGAIEC